MSDLEKLAAGFSSGVFVRPDPASANIIDLSRAIASVAGVKGLANSSATKELLDLIGAPDHIVFGLIDGLGVNLVRRMAPGSFFAYNMTRQLTTVFPSTTSVALTSIATGSWPGNHAVTGWFTHLPNINAAAAILPFTKRSDNRPLAESGVTAKHAFPVAPMLENAEVDCAFLLPKRMSDSVYSRYFSGGQPRIGYTSLRQAVDIIVDRVREAKTRTFTYLYTDRVDTEAHACGVNRPEIDGILLEVDQLFDELRQRLDYNAVTVISADHGFLDAAELQRHQIRSDDPLMPYLRYPPSGDARVLYLHVHSGAEHVVREYFWRRFVDKFLLITMDEAEEIGLFGPGPYLPETRRRMGDLIAISTGADVIEYRPRGRTGRVVHEAAQHSGLSPEEMTIPLIIA